MKTAVIAVALFGFLLNIGRVQQKPTSLQPTKMEAFAGQPAAHVTWSKEIGKIESDEARVIVTALSIEAAVPDIRRMCGIRIELTSRKARDQVYIEQAELDTLKKALEEIESGIDGFRKERRTSPYRYLGAAEFWHPHLKVHTLNAAYYIAPDSSGLSLSAYKGEEFRFPNHRLSELAKVVGTAIAELKPHCGS